jgi:hypothetical protein
MTARSASARLGFVGLAVALVVLAACSSTATAAPGASTPAGGSSSAAPSSAAPSSATLPGFSFPSDDKDLENLLPSTLCGQTAIKTSLNGASFAAGADPSFLGVLTQLGKTPADVGFALSTGDPTKAPDCQVSAGVFKINGVDSGQLQTVFLAVAAAQEQTYTQGNLGGKDVYVDASDPTSRNYFYVKGDGVFFVSAPDDATAGTVLSTLP